MANYYTPGVYHEQKFQAPSPLSNKKATIAAFVGITERGVLNTPTYVSCWADYIANFAYGLKSAFYAQSYLAYEVYGFFLNGGAGCYITSIKGAAAYKAAASLGDTSPIVFTAKDEGAWGNKISVQITANTDIPANFDVLIYCSASGTETLMEVYKNLNNIATSDRFYASIINDSSLFVSAASTGTLAVTPKTPLTAGSDDLSSITDTMYVNALDYFDTIEQIGQIAIPGMTSTTIHSGLSAYGNKRLDLVPVFDLSPSATPAQAKAAKLLITAKRGVVYYPAIYVSDPLSAKGALKICPNSGYVMGAISNSIAINGAGKAPGGINLPLKGIVNLVSSLTSEDTDLLSTYSVNCLLVKPYYGTVIWGVKTTSEDEQFKYLSSVLLNNEIVSACKSATLFAVFEPNNQRLWNKVSAVCKDILNKEWKSGFLFGNTASEAYYVKCDSENNTATSIAEGRLNIEVGYADTKPAEFIIFQFSQILQN